MKLRQYFIEITLIEPSGKQHFLLNFTDFEPTEALLVMVERQTIINIWNVSFKLRVMVESPMNHK